MTQLVYGQGEEEVGGGLNLKPFAYVAVDPLILWLSFLVRISRSMKDSHFSLLFCIAFVSLFTTQLSEEPLVCIEVEPPAKERAKGQARRPSPFSCRSRGPLITLERVRYSRLPWSLPLMEKRGEKSWPLPITQPATLTEDSSKGGNVPYC